jgi:hypothetical protein
MEFYVYLNGATRGPFAEERLQSFLADGLLQPTDLASQQRDSGWKQLSEFRRFHLPESSPVATASPLPAPPPLPPPAPRPIPPADVAAIPRITAAAVDPGGTAAVASDAQMTLEPNETPFYTTSLHWIVFVRFALLGLAVFLFAAIPFAIGIQALTGSEIGWFALPLPAFILLPPAVAFASSQMVITDRRVLIKTGIIRRQSMELFISKIESIGVDQGVFGRMLDYGTITIRGTGGFEEPFEWIANPLLFRSWIQRLQSGGAPPAQLERA